MVPSHLNLLSRAADACLLVIPSKWRACSQARCGFSLKCGAHHECSGDAVNKTEWDMGDVEWLGEVHSLPSIQPKSALEVWASITFCKWGMEMERDSSSPPFPTLLPISQDIAGRL